MNFLRTNLIYNVSRRAFSGTPTTLGHWNKDWAPGNFPKTEAERAAAAKKYNLLPEEYKPIPDDGHGAGDYPDFAPYSVESRDPFYPWAFPEYRRDFNEAMHENMNLYGEDRLDVNGKDRFGLPTMVFAFLGVMGTCGLLMYLAEDTVFIPAMPRHMPQTGVTHYKYVPLKKD